MPGRLPRGLIVGLSALAAGAAVALLGWVASFVIRDEVARAIAERTGAQVSVGGAWVGAGTHRFSDVRLVSVREGLEASIDCIEVEAPLFRLLSDGARAVDAVSFEGAEVALDLTAAAYAADPSPKARGERQAGLRSAGPTLSFEDVVVRVSDEVGPLAVFRGLGASKRGDAWHLSAQELVLGESARGERLRAVGITAIVGTSPLTLRSGGVGQVDIAVLSELGPDADEDDRGVRLTRRLLDARGMVRGRLRGRLGAGSGADKTGAAGGVAAMIAPGGSVHIARGGLRAVLPDGEEPIMENFSGSFSRSVSGRLETHGSGETEDGGRIAWTLDFGADGRRPTGRVLLDEVPLALLVPVLPPELPLFRPERARVAAELELTPVGTGEAADIEVDGRLAVRDLALDAPGVARSPIEGVSFAADGAGLWSPATRTLVVSSGRVRLRDVAVDLSGTLTVDGAHVALALDASLPSTPCGAAVGAIPRDALGELVGFSLDGRLAGNLHVVLDTRDPTLTEFRARIADGCRFDAVPALADLERFRGPFVHRVREPDGRWFEMTTGPGTDNWIPIERISPYFIHAVLAHEDGGFFEHHGFAAWAIEGALKKNLQAGRFVWGGSTITMQLAKNLFLARERTMVRKVQEVLLTWWLETSLGKLDILELYLNVIEYGPAVYGVRNAAWHYFRRRPAELSPAESAYLASILPAPKRYQTSYQRGELTRTMNTKLVRRLEHMHSRERIDERALAYGVGELERFAFADPASTDPAPLRVLPAGAAPIPRLGTPRPEDWGWEETGPVDGIDLGGTVGLDLDLDLGDDDEP